jgi:hypothetical protein
MKKIIIASLLAAIVLPAAFAADEKTAENEEAGPFLGITAISPYAGSIAGVDIVFRDKFYVGVGRNFMTDKNSDKPKYILRKVLSGPDIYSPLGVSIKSESSELFHVSFGMPGEKFSAGLQFAFGELETIFDRQTTFGMGLEASWNFLDNLFVKGSAAYFFGAEDFRLNGETYFFLDKIDGGYYKKSDKVAIGGDWKFGVAIGYRFNL